MNAHEILTKVAETITQRGNDNGYDKQEERSATEIALLMKVKYGTEHSEESVLRTLIALKEVRLNRQLSNGVDPTDTLIDLIGYTALLAECLTEKNKAP